MLGPAPSSLRHSPSFLPVEVAARIHIRRHGSLPAWKGLEKRCLPLFLPRRGAWFSPLEGVIRQGGQLLQQQPKMTAKRISHSPSGPTMAFLVGHLYWAILVQGGPGSLASFLRWLYLLRPLRCLCAVAQGTEDRWPCLKVAWLALTCPHCIGPATSREAGKCRLAECPGGRGNQVWRVCGSLCHRKCGCLTWWLCIPQGNLSPPLMTTPRHLQSRVLARKW